MVAPALVVGIVYGRGWGRVLCGLAFALLAPNLFGGLLQLDVSAVGHTTAILVALLAVPALVRFGVVRAEPAPDPTGFGQVVGFSRQRADRRR